MFSNKTGTMNKNITTMTKMNFLKSTILIFALAILFSSAFSAKAANISSAKKLSTSTVGFTSNGKVKMKKTASEKSKTVSSIPKNKECKVIKSYTSGWSVVKYNGKRGYVKTKKIATGEKARKLIQKQNQQNLGTFRITAYCGCSSCCGKWAGSALNFSHRLPRQGFTISVDPNVIPLGSYVLIDGHVYYAEDTGVHGNSVDIYFNSHSAALAHGMHYSNVILLKNDTP